MEFARFFFSLFLFLHLLEGVFHSSVFGGPDLDKLRSSREPKYKVEFHPEHSPFYPVDSQEKIAMSNNEGQKFMCFLPVVEETKILKSVTQENSSTIIMESDRKNMLKTPDELLDVLKDGDCFYRLEGWWTYEFCFQKHVKQLHVEDEQAVQEFVLGIFDPDETAALIQKQSDVSTLKDPRSKDASQRYHAHQYTNGTICDLTNQPRETEVRFVCSELTVVISSVKEISTCKYVVTVQCPLLCKHPMFQQERSTWHTVHCNEIGSNEKGSSLESGKGTQIVIVAADDTAGSAAT